MVYAFQCFGNKEIKLVLLATSLSAYSLFIHHLIRSLFLYMCLHILTSMALEKSTHNKDVTDVQTIASRL